jgi:ABC-type transport system substrate-binding protein
MCRPPRRAVLAACLLALAVAGCVPRAGAPRATAWTWLAGRPEPAFDPGGPPEPLRWSLERLLGRGLVREGFDGTPEPDAAESWSWSDDSLALTFRLRAGLTFADGSPCGSAEFRAALLRPLARTDHATQSWLLAAVTGVERVRAGRPLPPLGIETPDGRTLVLRLARPDPLLPARLALPGASAPWRSSAAGTWLGSIGLGGYRVLAEEPGHALTLLRRGGGAADSTSGEPGAAWPDTLRIRFQPNPARLLAFLRARGAELVWPLPATLDPAAVPAPLRLTTRLARPRRTLLLVMRADVPPTSRAPTRHALAEAMNQERVLEALGPRAGRLDEWLPGAGPFPRPPFDEEQVRAWMERGRLGRAFHVALAYDADGPEAVAARTLQGQWASLGIYAELRPLRGAALERERLTGTAQLVLAVAQALPGESAGPLAGLVMPLRGPAVGAFRTGWRTREFDPLLAPGGAPAGNLKAVQDRVAEEAVVLPLAGLPWVWLERSDRTPVRFHPRFGPEGATSSDVETSAAGNVNPR